MRLTRLEQLLGGWPRRLVALGCLLLAGVSALHTSASSPVAAGDRHDVVVATRELAAGAVITADDLQVASWPAALRPSTAVAGSADAIGHRLAAPVGTGEAITSTRLVGIDLSAGLPTGLIAAPIPLVDPGAAALIRAGNYVDLLSPSTDAARPAGLVAQGVLVLAVLPSDPATKAMTAQLVVAVDRAAELRIAQAITSPMLATVIKPP